VWHRRRLVVGRWGVAVFDLDGTRADTAGDLVGAANATLAVAGLDEAVVARLYPRLLAFYAEGLAVETRLYDGAETALDRLAAAGWGLAVCTNKPEGLALSLLDALGIGGRFRVVLGADSLAWRKPDPRHLVETIRRAGGRRERAVLVGDTVTDREAARAAGVPCVLVGFGPEGSEVAALAPEAMLAHYDELPALLERLVPPA
jgi:phosphoglycolate phosphatase